jgi:hypothetical protein
VCRFAADRSNTRRIHRGASQLRPLTWNSILRAGKRKKPWRAAGDPVSVPNQRATMSHADDTPMGAPARFGVHVIDKPLYGCWTTDLVTSANPLHRLTLCLARPVPHHMPQEGPLNRFSSAGRRSPPAAPPGRWTLAAAASTSSPGVASGILAPSAASPSSSLPLHARPGRRSCPGRAPVHARSDARRANPRVR